MKKAKTAIITGASSGMGREFVLQLDKSEKFDEIWVIARREDRLLSLKDKVSAKLKILPLDLTKSECIEKYKNELKKTNPDIAVLVNASGFGKFGNFLDISLSDQQEMIDLNVKALVSFTYISLEYMNKGGRIYQLDSLSSFQPVPYMTVYASTKAFVLSFSRSLNVELKSSGIKVMAVSPGWVKTEFFDRAKSDSTVSYYNKFYTPKQVVTKAIADMKKGKDLSVCGFSVRMQVLSVKLLPHRLVMRIWVRQQKKSKNEP